MCLDKFHKYTGHVRPGQSSLSQLQLLALGSVTPGRVRIVGTEREWDKVRGDDPGARGDGGSKAEPSDRGLKSADARSCGESQKVRGVVPLVELPSLAGAPPGTLTGSRGQICGSFSSCAANSMLPFDTGEIVPLSALALR